MLFPLLLLLTVITSTIWSYTGPAGIRLFEKVTRELKEKEPKDAGRLDKIPLFFCIVLCCMCLDSFYML